LIKENDKLKIISEDLVKNTDMLSVKLNKNQNKLSTYERKQKAKDQYPSVEVQCNIINNVVDENKKSENKDNRFLNKKNLNNVET